jgi:hypothetical protein
MKHPAFIAIQAVGTKDCITGDHLTIIYGLTASGEVYEKIGNTKKPWTKFDSEVEGA